MGNNLISKNKKISKKKFNKNNQNANRTKNT